MSHFMDIDLIVSTANLGKVTLQAFTSHLYVGQFLFSPPNVTIAGASSVHVKVSGKYSESEYLGNVDFSWVRRQ